MTLTEWVLVSLFAMAQGWIALNGWRLEQRIRRLEGRDQQHPQTTPTQED